MTPAVGTIVTGGDGRPWIVTCHSETSLGLVPASRLERVKWWLRLRLDLGIELAASLPTLAGIFVGSTTAQGACFYLASLVFWFWMMARKQLWGLLPLNVASLLISILNLWRAVQ